MKNNEPTQPSKEKNSLSTTFALCAGTSAAFLLITTLLTAPILAPLLLGKSNVLDNSTGEENLDNIAPFSTIRKDGDTRINRIIDILERSKEGRDIVRFASENPITFQWLDRKDGPAGSYSIGNGQIELNVRITDKHAALVLGHEIRHAWQDHTIPLSRQIRDPIAIWEYATLAEVDACAYTARFAAEYKDETGVSLVVDNTLRSYGDFTAQNYSQISATQRDFYRQAVLPCFAEISNYSYPWSHLNLAKGALESAQYIVRNAKRDPIGSPMMADMTPLDNTEKKELFSRFFNQSMLYDDPLPEMTVLSPDGFASWLKSVTQGDPEIAQTLEKLEQEFSKLQPRPAVRQPVPEV